MSEELPVRNETLRSIRERHSVRVFSDAPVSDEDVRTILHAANQAPSAHNEQSWRFIVLKGERKQALARLVTAAAGRFPRAPAALLRMAARSIAGAPVVVAVANSGDLIARGPALFGVEEGPGRDFFRVMEIQSSAAAVENLLVAATSLGLATVWLGVLVLVKDDVLRFLDEPRGEFMAVVPVGHTARPAAGPRKRPLETTVKTLE
ncbi:MAG: nitroreductase family protein [Candidatus Edwardsbacteria bacterium]|jgi:nitroreductase|nr:nitroreductase family protein [Candidatus Edwardsbacteria bacterium]